MKLPNVANTVTKIHSNDFNQSRQTKANQWTNEISSCTTKLPAQRKTQLFIFLHFVSVSLKKWNGVYFSRLKQPISVPKQMVNNRTENVLYIHLCLRYSLFEWQFT